MKYKILKEKACLMQLRLDVSVAKQPTSKKENKHNMPIQEIR